MEESRGRTALLGGGGIALVVALWWLLALTLLKNHHVPTPVEVGRAFKEDGWGFYQDQFGVTVREAVKGFLVGTVSAIALSAVVLLLPFAEPVVMQVAVITYCMPIVAIAPVLSIVIGAPEAGQPSGTAVALAALSVFFTTVVGAVLGFRSADRTSLDLVQVYGGSKLQQLRKVQLVAALPAIVGALQIAAPAAFLGAILGEFAGGGVEQGVGPALVQAQTTLDSGTAWAIGFACALLAGIGYALFGLVGRLVTPWSKGVAA